MRKNLCKLCLYGILAMGFIPQSAWSEDIELSVTTEPEGARITFISLDRKITKTYFAPAKISYDPTMCYNPYLIVELQDYVKKMVKLDKIKSEFGIQELHIVLDKLTPEQIKQEERVDIGVPDNLFNNIPNWASEINSSTPAFDPTHQ